MLKKWMKLCLFALALSACGGGSSSDDPAKANKSESYTYSYTVNGCATGVHTSSNLRDYCLDLSDDNLNHNCADGVRCETFNRECSELGLGITCD